MHGNHLGSMTLLTDEAGDVVEEARYYPFGGYRLPPTEGITDIGFTGHRQDNLGWENTGLIYMGARLGTLSFEQVSFVQHRTFHGVEALLWLPEQSGVVATS